MSIRKIFKSIFNKTSKYSQAGQDLFAFELFGNCGTYVDIGAGEPINLNNTYFLEVEKNWKGISVDYGDHNLEKIKELKNLWENCHERKNKIYWADALTFNYKQALDENNIKYEIDFLSCDIDPQKNTFLALKKIINDGVRPKYIAFETDYYREKIDYSNIAYNFLRPYGYKIGVKNVYSNLKKNKIFETWFVSKSIKFNSIEYEKWVKK